jgi:hypothetical protein
MEKLIILDYSTGTVDIYDTQYDIEPDMDDLIDSLGHRANDCVYMFAQSSEITFHKEILK